MANREESNFLKVKRPSKRIVCSNCGNGSDQLFRVPEKEKSKNPKKRVGKFEKTTAYICVNCKK